MIRMMVALGLKLFFLFTPFFALSMFLAMTAGRPMQEGRCLAARTALATVVIAGLLFFCGRVIFNVFGLTVDAFRIGAGALFFLRLFEILTIQDA